MTNDQIEEAATRAGCWAIPWTEHGSSARHNAAIVARVHDIAKQRTCADCKHYDTNAFNPECVHPLVGKIALDGWDYPARLCPPADFGCNRWTTK